MGNEEEIFLLSLESQSLLNTSPICSTLLPGQKKLWYIYAMEYYSAIERNTFESVLVRWINLEPVIQSEVSHKEKNKYCILMHIYGI